MNPSLSAVLMSAAFMGGLGGLLALMLAFASRRFAVWEDPRIDQVEAMLPKSNCGACGMAGCRNFAERATLGEIAPGLCTVSTPAQREAIAALLGVEAGIGEARVARLACAGGRHVAYQRARYEGAQSCRAANVLAGGGKGCAWGCLGLGDCVSACTFDAIALDANGLPVVDAAKCVACDDCVAICPKGLFSLHPVSHQLWVACNNRAEPDLAERDCEVACTACGKCVADAAPGLIRLQNNLAVVGYASNSLARRDAIERCPTGAIVWFDNVRAAHATIKGHAAKKILRRTPLPLRAD